MTPDLLAALDSGALAIAVNTRLARSLRREYGEEQVRRGSRAWRSPQILTWPGWMKRLWSEAIYSGDGALPAMLTPEQELSLWEQSVAGHADGESLLSLEATASAAQSAWRRLHEYRLPRKHGAWEYHQDGSAFLEWAAAFEKSCDSLRRIDDARWTDYAIRLIQEKKLRVPAQNWLVGFDELTPLQRAMVEAAELAGAHITNLADKFTRAQNCSVIALPDSTAELQAAAAWAREKFQADASARIGVVVPDLKAVRGRVDQAFRKVFHPGEEPRDPAYHIALGPSLAERPLVSSALLMLGLFEERIPQPVASRILLSPYLGGAEQERNARASLDFALRGGLSAEWKAMDVARHGMCPSILARLLRDCDEFRRRLPHTQKPSQWSRAISELLKILGWPGDHGGNSEEYQVAEAWGGLLSGLASLDATTDPISSGRARSLLTRLAADEVFEVENLSQPVQIMDIAESRGAAFDALWVTGLHDEAWPAPPSPVPFVPLALQKEFALPGASPALCLAEARRATERLLGSATEVIVSYPRSDGDRALAPSPLIEDIPRGERPRDEQRAVVAAAPLETIEDAMAPELAKGSAQRGGANLLKLQAACPFRAFAQLRLGAEPMESAELGIPARDRGTILHRALKNLAPYLPHADAGQIAEAVELALAETPSGKLRDVEQTRLCSLLSAWVAFENERETPFEVLQTEEDRRVELGGLRLRTRIDRIDRLPDGRIVLIDYKSSEHSSKEWDGDRPDEPQVPLYAITAAEPLAGVAFAQVQTGACGFHGATQVSNLLPKVKPECEEEFDERISEWKRVLEDLASGFRAGDAAVDPKIPETTCEQCHLAMLCRIHEAQS